MSEPIQRVRSRPIMQEGFAVVNVQGDDRHTDIRSEMIQTVLLLALAAVAVLLLANLIGAINIVI